MRSTTIIVAGFIALAVSPTAHASTRRAQPGVYCEGLYQNWAKMYREERGILNLDTTQPQGVVCPSQVPEFDTQFSGCQSGNLTEYVYYDDESNVDNFFCQMYMVTNTGTMTWGVGRYTCNQTGGCSSPTSSYLGTGVLYLPSLSGSTCGTETALNFGAICNLPRHASPGATFLVGTRGFTF